MIKIGDGANSEKEMDMNLTQLLPKMYFAAANCRFLCVDGKRVEEYWTADIKAMRLPDFCKIFKDVHFQERPGRLVYLSGNEDQDANCEYLGPESALSQQEFIRFLREESRRKQSAWGPLAGAFSDGEYAVFTYPLVAFLAARGLQHPLGVSYLSRSREYKHLVLAAEEGSICDPDRYPAFDELTFDWMRDQAPFSLPAKG